MSELANLPPKPPQGNICWRVRHLWASPQGDLLQCVWQCYLSDLLSQAIPHRVLLNIIHIRFGVIFWSRSRGILSDIQILTLRPSLQANLHLVLRPWIPPGSRGTVYMGRGYAIELSLTLARRVMLIEHCIPSKRWKITFFESVTKATHSWKPCQSLTSPWKKAIQAGPRRKESLKARARAAGTGGWIFELPQSFEFSIHASSRDDSEIIVVMTVGST